MSLSVTFEGHHVLLRNEPIIIGRLNGRTVVPLSRTLEAGAHYIQLTGEKVCAIFNMINATSALPAPGTHPLQLEETIPGAVAENQSILIGWRPADATDRAIAPFQCEQPTSFEDVGTQLFGRLQRVTTLTGSRLCEYVNAFIARAGNIPSDIVYHHTT